MDADIGNGIAPLIDLVLHIHQIGKGSRGPEVLAYILDASFDFSFLKACLDLPSGRCSPLRGMVHGTALALLYLTGMRVGEALSLNLEDVDLSNGVIRIRRGKFGKSRFVPMAQDLTDRMEQCRLFVDRSLGIRPPSACFFPGPKGSRCTKGVLRYSFRIVLTEAKIPYWGAGKGPRDLRHAYAIHRMMLWYEQGAVLGGKIRFAAATRVWQPFTRSSATHRAASRRSPCPEYLGSDT